MHSHQPVRFARQVWIVWGIRSWRQSKTWTLDRREKSYAKKCMQKKKKKKGLVPLHVNQKQDVNDKTFKPKQESKVPCSLFLQVLHAGGATIFGAVWQQTCTHWMLQPQSNQVSNQSDVIECERCESWQTALVLKRGVGWRSVLVFFPQAERDK